LARSEAHRGASSAQRPTRPEDAHTPLDTEMERLLGRLRSSLDEEKGPKGALRALPTWARFALAGAGILAMVAGVFLTARRADFDAYPPIRLSLWVVSYVGLLALLASRTLRPLFRTIEPAGREMALVAACFAAPFVWALIPPAHLLHFVDTTGGGRDCLVLGVALGTAVIVLMRALDRAPDSNFRAAALGAAAGGLTANLALVFHCPKTHPLHLLVVHAPIGLVLLFAYRRVLKRFALRRAG